ncbi:unnamed protein product [Ambrosiozyma monospora]|uniref:Unnamed protein product n=1 Tax=Ambrosiozyma monospora TaxID=43982 RepID=A0ACB5T4Z4_AMBMO|nr:unnamed protein product [Ambrosiozyma monospora]
MTLKKAHCCSASDLDHSHDLKLETTTIDIAKELQSSVTLNNDALNVLQGKKQPQQGKGLSSTAGFAGSDAGSGTGGADEEIDTSSLTFTPASKASQFYTLAQEQHEKEQKQAKNAVSSKLDKPWRKDPHHFKTVHISLQAFLKMSIHARAGGQLEIMGMLTGTTSGSDMIIMDCYPLPVHGTESRVNPITDAYPFMLSYLSQQQQFGYRKENIIGWYHSHPGFGCWLSGIDVDTQSMNQGFQDPYVALVVDPEKSIRQGFVEIGAFRTYYEDNMPTSSDTGNGKSLGNVGGISSKKLQDFGHHANRYYSLGIKIFKSEQDEKILSLLDSKFWYSGLVDTKQEDEILQIAKIDSVAHNIKHRDPVAVRRMKPSRGSKKDNKSGLSQQQFAYESGSAGLFDMHSKMKRNRQMASQSQDAIMASLSGNEGASESSGNAGGNIKNRSRNLKFSQDVNLLGAEALKGCLLREVQEELFLF